MRRFLSEQLQLETQEETNGDTFVTKVFRISQRTFLWLGEHGRLSIARLHWPRDYGFYAVSADAIAADGNWAGWLYLHNDMVNSGLIR